MSKKNRERSPGSPIWVRDFDDNSSLQFHSDIWQAFLEDPCNPLTIHIDSFGGSVYSLLHKMETMDNIRAVAPEEFFFITYVHTTAFSCGIMLAAHGDLRWATPKSRLMFHEGTNVIYGRDHQIDIQYQDMKIVNDMVDNIFIADTGFKGGLEGLRKWGEKDRYLSPQQAKELGIIDRIGYIKPKQLVFTSPSFGECDALSLRKTVSKEEKPKAKRPAVKKKTTKKK